MKKPHKPPAVPKKSPPAPKGLSPKEQDFQDWMNEIELPEEAEPAPAARPAPRPKAT